MYEAIQEKLPCKIKRGRGNFILYDSKTKKHIML